MKIIIGNKLDWRLKNLFLNPPAPLKNKFIIIFNNYNDYEINYQILYLY